MVIFNSDIANPVYGSRIQGYKSDSKLETYSKMIVQEKRCITKMNDL